jgi:hypothetical protein
MNELQLVTEDDIRDIVHDECEFLIETHGIGYYEYGNGKYNDTSKGITLTCSEIKVQYPIDVDSMIYTLVAGTLERLDDDGNSYECDWVAELLSIKYNRTTKVFDTIYEVFPS